MFTGIIEKTGKVVDIIHEKTNVHFVIEVDFAHELKIDQREPTVAADNCKIRFGQTAIRGHRHAGNLIENEFKTMACRL